MCWPFVASSGDVKAISRASPPTIFEAIGDDDGGLKYERGY